MEELLRLRTLRHRRYGRMNLTPMGSLALGGLRLYIFGLLVLVALHFVKAA